MNADNKILVIGGGMSGLTAALEAAEAGSQVIITEAGPYLGGRVAQLHRYFPKLCPPTCGLEINFRRIKENPNISIYTMAVGLTPIGTLPMGAAADGIGLPATFLIAGVIAVVLAIIMWFSVPSMRKV